MPVAHIDANTPLGVKRLAPCRGTAFASLGHSLGGPRHRVGEMKKALVALAFASLAVACTGQGEAPDHPRPRATTAAGPSVSPSPSLQFTTEIHAPRPSGERDSWDSIIFSAADKVCSSRDGFSAGTQDATTTDAAVVIRCDSAGPRYVHVIFNGVTVPHLSTNRLALVGHRLEQIGLSVGRVTFRSRAANADVVRQSPRPGRSYPSGPPSISWWPLRTSVRLLGPSTAASR